MLSGAAVPGFEALEHVEVPEQQRVDEDVREGLSAKVRKADPAPEAAKMRRRRSSSG